MASYTFENHTFRMVDRTDGKDIKVPSNMYPLNREAQLFTTETTDTISDAHVREILLKWISDAMENPAGVARTEDGRRFVLDMSQSKSRCVVHCEDGNFTMPQMSIIFQEEES